MHKNLAIKLARVIKEESCQLMDRQGERQTLPDTLLSLGHKQEGCKGNHTATLGLQQPS